MKRILGIDPGITGALALVISEPNLFRLEYVDDLPSMVRPLKKHTSKTKRRMLSGVELARLIRSLKPDFAFVESVRALPPKRYYDPKLRKTVTQQGMGATSAFSFGETLGIIRGILCSIEIPHEMIEPQTWKKIHGLSGAEKTDALPLARSLFPSAASALKRKKDLGRAEALLIARAGHFILRSDSSTKKIPPAEPSESRVYDLFGAN